MIRIVVLNLALSIMLLSCSKMNAGTVQDGPAGPFEGEDVPAMAYQSYGLIGDGLTDNTVGLQKLVNERSTIYLKAGVYIINQTINLKAGVKIYGEASTVIKAGNQMSGTLLNNGRYFFGDASDLVLIKRITFRQSDKPYSWAEWNNACIYLLNCKSTIIENNVFDFHLPYAMTGMEAVWISGPESLNNRIKNNKVETLGIKYAENGADNTLVEGNVLNNAYSNALTANGNHISDYSSGCQVLNNIINNAGRMAIEDWGKTDQSLIKGNFISGTGKDVRQAIDGIGLSAVGTNVKVIGNTIADNKLYAIEVRGNYNVQVSDNIIADNKDATAIILNQTFPVPGNINHPVAALVNWNRISNSTIGVHVFGDYEADAGIYSNTFTNVGNKGISIECGSPKYNLTIERNHFKFTVKPAKERFGVFSYTKYNPGEGLSQMLTLVADTFTYAPSATGGYGADMAIVIRTDKAAISDIVVQGNDNKSSGGTPVYAITAFGARPKGLKLKNNKVLGATVDLKGFTDVESTGNNF